jgi:hypothetical protein
MLVLPVSLLGPTRVNLASLPLPELRRLAQGAGVQLARNASAAVVRRALERAFEHDGERA